MACDVKKLISNMSIRNTGHSQKRVQQGKQEHNGNGTNSKAEYYDTRNHLN